MWNEVQLRLRLESDLRRAIERREFRVLFQPIHRLRDGSIEGAEALVRWQLPDATIVSPADFIAVAEQTGLIVPIGEWVLREAAREAAAWPATGTPLPVSVNVSARQFHDHAFVPTLRGILADTGLVPDRLVVELVETVVLNEADATRARLDELRSLGVRVALDDFGTGYSSLGYLRRLPVDVLKIDRSFVEEVEHSDEARALARSIVHIGRTLRLETIAEGIETSAQAAALLAMGCELGQGYHFAQPMTPSHFHDLLLRPLAATRAG
jgi:EAL domain-containing protein (putative c-di-GMP-specific phosphodiesterase class I)